MSQVQSKIFTHRTSCPVKGLLTTPLYVRHKNIALKITAMFDTGAETSVISPTLREYLDIPTCCSADIRGVHGVQECDVVRADISFDDNMWFIKRRLPVCDFSRTGIDILIGLDILKKGEFTVKNNKDQVDITFSMELTEQI